MTEPESLTADQLGKLFLLLMGPEEEWDDATIDAMLRLQGITREELGDDLRLALEQEVENHRSRGEEVPEPLLEVISSLKKSPESKDQQQTPLAVNH